MNGPLKFHGGKGVLAARIVALMPPRRSCKNPDGWLHYVEPYFGGGSVLLENSPDDISEVANDLDGELTNYWRVLQSDEAFGLFIRRVEATPFSEWEWKKSNIRLLLDDIDVEHAAKFFVNCRQSLAGRMKSFTGVTKTRVRRRMNNEVSAWLTAVEGLPAVHERLKRVLILNRPALEVIRKHDTPGTLAYCDPPYLHQTRVTTSDYANEMSESDHAELLSVLAGVTGKFILSGYPSEMYDAAIRKNGWYRTDIDIANHAAGGESKRRMTEMLVTNYEPACA